MERSEDNLKWFGEGFDGFPKRLPEDCVQYAIYVIEPQLEELATREILREVQSAATLLTRKLLKNFIWQREGFALSLEREDGRGILRGQTNYGDSVEDEWLIVYILRELSKQFPNTWIRVMDSDGQFLLIEAANSLPLWLNPEVADNRVWINDGRLLIIPIDKPGGKARLKQVGSDSLDLTSALKLIESPTAKILHSAKIEQEAFYRLQKYPQNVVDSLHYSLMKVPRKLAYVLHDNPAYISPAVEAFYLRDPIALRTVQAKGGSKLVFPPKDLVTISAKFTKVGFAQLMSQRFSVPPSWAGVSMLKGDGKVKARADLGMKVACGFEMLVSDSQNRDKKAYREIAMLVEDVDAGDALLPTDDDIRKWGLREDDESWLDIDFKDFEKELNGNMRRSQPDSGGFGDQRAQENLRKMVSRFEDFLKDDDAGADGAELVDDMEIDDDSSEYSESERSDEEDEDAKDIDVDKDEFTIMMRDMMGMPAGVMDEIMGKAKPVQTGDHMGLKSITAPRLDGTQSISHPTVRNNNSDAVQLQQEDDDVRRSMDQIEHELREAGALDMNSNYNDDDMKLSSSSLDKSNAQAKSEDTDDYKLLDVEANLIKNMLESFKGQAGAAGPGGSLMGLMGMQLPRDEDENSEE